jgi:hypothetical protein
MDRSGTVTALLPIGTLFDAHRLQTLIDLAIEHGVELPAYTVDELRRTLFRDAIGSLEKYLECFRYTTAVLQTPSALERVAYELACDNYDEHVFYFEVRFAPQLHANQNMDMTTVLNSVNRGLAKARDEYNRKEHVTAGLLPSFDYGIIVCGMRSFDENYSAYYKEFIHVHRYEAPYRLRGLATVALITVLTCLTRVLGHVCDRPPSMPETTTACPLLRWISPEPKMASLPRTTRRHTSLRTSTL